MIIQKDKPQPGDPFFNNGRGKYPGISTCINGNPMDPDNNTLVNCVAIVGAYNKAARDGEKKWGPIMYPPNAGGIISYAAGLGLPTSKEPEVGALIVWKKGQLTETNTNGHVAFVTKVDADGTIHTAESEYNGRAWVNRSYRKPYYYADGYTFIGFVLQPRKSAPSGYIRKGDKGSAVVWLQERLRAAAKDNPMYDPGNIDGDFGDKTERALVYFQFKKGLAVDGVAGPATQAALSK